MVRWISDVKVKDRVQVFNNVMNLISGQSPRKFYHWATRYDMHGLLG